MRIKALDFRRRRNGLEVVVTFDDDSALTLDAEIAVQFQLASGAEIPEARLVEIKIANENLLSRRKLIQWLALRKKSEREARSFLKEKGFDSIVSDQAIDHARRLGYLNDRDYAESFVRTRIKLSDKGPYLVENELRQKGIDPALISEVVAPLTDTEEQLTAARAAAEKKMSIFRREQDLAKASQKLTAYLIRKGYGSDIAWQVTRDYFGDPTQF